MATRKVTTCDVPGCEEDATSFALSRGTYRDGAGGQSEQYRMFDLCPGHTKALARKAMEALPYDVQDEILSLLNVPLNPLD